MLRSAFVSFTMVASLATSGCASHANPEEASESESTLTRGSVTGIPGCPGSGWIDPASWDKLKGSYLRAQLVGAPLDELTSVTVFSNPSPNPSINPPRYSRTTGLGIQTGTLIADPSNPAIGPLFVFRDEQAVTRDVYWAPWQQRSAITGNITAVCLAKAVSSEEGPRSAFVIKRVGF